MECRLLSGVVDALSSWVVMGGQSLFDVSLKLMEKASSFLDLLCREMM
jgi:hypothetical protein